MGKIREVNSLQRSYNIYRDAGGEQSAFMISNDLGDDLAGQLERIYQESLSEPRSSEYLELVERCREALVEESEAVNRLVELDDLQWLTGTGRLAQ